MANNFLSIQNPNPPVPSMPFMMPPVVIAPMMLPGILGPVPMMVPMMNPGQMPTNNPNVIAHSNCTAHFQAYHRPLQSIHANSHHPPGIPAPVAPTSRRITSQSVFHSLVVKRLLKYIEKKARKDSVETEVIDLVSDDEEEEGIIVVDSPRIENSMLDVTTREDSGRFSEESEFMEDEEKELIVMDSPRIENSILDVTTPEDSGRYSGDPDAPQANEEVPEEKSMENEFIVVDSPILSDKSFEEAPCLDNNPPSSEVPVVNKQKRRRNFLKYNMFYSLFTTAQIECLDSIFTRNGTITPEEIKYLADGNELAEEQIKKWQRNRKTMKRRRDVRKTMKNMTDLITDV